MSQQAYEKLNGHTWPGNIRELKNVVERAAILCESQFIDIDDIFFSHEMGRNILPLTNKLPRTDQPLKELVADLEKKVIVRTLKKHNTIRQSAKILGISHPALINKMKKYKIQKVSRIRVGH